MVGSVKAVLRRPALWVLESTITECQPTGSLPRCCFVSSHCRWRYLVRTQAIRKTTAPRGLIPFTVDRKSTRLNSSHLVISYAVFCLKKKKKKKTICTIDKHVESIISYRCQTLHANC